MSFGIKLSVATMSVLLGANLLSAPAIAATTPPDGLSFAVKVSNAGGAPFKDCFSFDTAGNLTVAGLASYGTLVFADDVFGKSISWVAVAPQTFVDAFTAGIMFTGGVVASGKLKATGMSSGANTYAITGHPVTKCKGTPDTRANWKSLR